MILGIFYKKYVYFAGYIVASGVGTYIIPSFLIPFLANSMVGIAICLIQKDKKGAKIVIFSSLLIGFGIVFCYMPVFLFSGMSSVVGNKYMVTVHQPEFIRSRWQSRSAFLPAPAPKDGRFF